MPADNLRFVDSPTARLAVYDDGGSDDPVMLLHGGPGVPDYLGEVAATLISTHRVVRFDQRGTGRSTCRSDTFGLRDYVDDVDAVRSSCGFERVSLFGHSWGGNVAQLYAAAYPERVARLCLCNSSVGVGEDWRVMERAVLAYNRQQSGLLGFAALGGSQLLMLLPGPIGDFGARRVMARAWRNYFHPPESAPPPAAAWLAGVHAPAMLRTRAAVLAADAGSLAGRCGGQDLPVLIVYGDRDIYGSTTERLVSRYPGARVVVIPDCGHIPWLQNRQAFVDVVCRFLAS